MNRRMKGVEHYPELESLVFKAMGAADFETPLEQATHPAVWKYLNSGFHDADTPILHMNHNRLKLPEEHLDKHFSMEELEKLVLNIPDIKSFLSMHPELEKQFKPALRNAVFFHQVKSPFYWRKASGKAYLKSITAAAEGIPPDMNEYNANRAAEALGDIVRRKGSATILDIGTGAGSTIEPVLKKLEGADNEAIGKVKVVLNCVQPDLEKVRDNLVKMGVKTDNIILLPTTFYAFAQAMGVKGMPEKHPWPFADKNRLRDIGLLRGKVDLIVSGASLNNLPHSRLLFDTLHTLLNKGGKAFLWDWGGFDLAKKTYTQKELSRTIKTTGGTKVTVRNNIRGFWRFWLYHHGYISPKEGEEKAWEELDKYICNSPTVNVYGWFTEHFKKFEEYRKGRDFTTLGFANRAYRTPEDVKAVANKVGFKVNSVSYPLADRDYSGDSKILGFNEPPNPRFVTWQAELEKTGMGGFKRFAYQVGSMFARKGRGK